MADAKTEDQPEPKRWSLAADEKLKKMFLADARKKCDHKVKEFVACSKEHGLLVFLKCHDENKAMNDCVKELTSDEQFAEFRAMKIKEYEANGQIIIDRDAAYVGPPK
mmetsp:Transcript_15490/g.27525  ORF Transcript_15490/g.27525 Transcript_15490/m.27525 type:complete len:108 (-) Transcript_15490:40-363(-)